MPVTNAVIDLSHHNNAVDFKAAAKAGLIGVFHKAAQGSSGVDPAYLARRSAAHAEGLLWGAYHFGTGSDGVRQAEFFLKTVGDPKDLLLVLDFEGNPTGPSMSLEEARAFVTHVREKTGRWPGLYSGHYLKELLHSGADPVLAQCWLWLAQYGPTAVVPANWATWTFWQYTDGAIGPTPHGMAGIGTCDRDKFNGAKAALRTFWGGAEA
jgi:lysozyme